MLIDKIVRACLVGSPDSSHEAVISDLATQRIATHLENDLGIMGIFGLDLLFLVVVVARWKLLRYALEIGLECSNLPACFSALSLNFITKAVDKLRLLGKLARDLGRERAQQVQHLLLLLLEELLRSLLHHLLRRIESLVDGVLM